MAQSAEQKTMPTAVGPTGQGNHVVKQGECIQSIAFAYGLPWQSVWNDGQNAQLKQQRKNPNALLPGDQVFVRELKQKEVDAATEKRHRFRVKNTPAVLKLRLLDEGKPRANETYQLEIDGRTYKGSTDGDGRLEQKIPPDATTGRLTVGPNKDEYQLDLRHLDPAEEPTGLQGRLLNLGYNPGVVDGDVGPRTRDALMRFQKDNGLEATGEADQPTLDKLKQVYGEN